MQQLTHNKHTHTMSDKIKTLTIENAVHTSEGNVVIDVKYGRDRYRIDHGVSKYVVIAIRDAMSKHAEANDGVVPMPFKMPDGVLAVIFGDEGEPRLHQVGESKDGNAVLDIFTTVVDQKEAATERGRHLSEIRAAGGNSNRKRRYSRNPSGSNLLQS